MKQKQNYQLALLVLFLISNFPLLEIANNRYTILGIPFLYFYLFMIWMVSIVLMYRFASKYFL